MDDILKELWSVELSILDVFHQVCCDNHLVYSLSYGTLLGAVRHKGFIPWDDDVDVMMPRKDYEKLIQIWDECAPKDYTIETEKSSDEYNNNFSKIRKAHTTFLQSDKDRERDIQKGIFIDVFPMDRRARGPLFGRLQYLEFALNLLFNRGYPSGSSGAVGFIEKVLLGVVPKRCYRKLSIWFGEISRVWNSDPLLKIVSASTISDTNKLYDKDLFENCTLIEFQGRHYYAIKDTDSFLRICYGDYMTLPPKEERTWKHHPVLVDFEHNYEEI